MSQALKDALTPHPSRVELLHTQGEIMPRPSPPSRTRTHEPRPLDPETRVTRDPRDQVTRAP